MAHPLRHDTVPKQYASDCAADPEQHADIVTRDEDAADACIYGHQYVSIRTCDISIALRAYIPASSEQFE